MCSRELKAPARAPRPARPAPKNKRIKRRLEGEQSLTTQISISRKLGDIRTNTWHKADGGLGFDSVIYSETGFLWPDRRH